MLIITNFKASGVPKTGLSPTIDIYESDGTQVITAQAMTEIAGGFYKYEFAAYDEDKDYGIIADGTSTLSNSERYAMSTNEKAPIGKILKIEKGNWKIAGNQMLFYDTDGSTPIYTFDLKNKAGSPTEIDVFKREVV